MWGAIGVVDDAMNDAVPQPETRTTHDKICASELARAGTATGTAVLQTTERKRVNSFPSRKTRDRFS
ncbi:MAG: hypothetical protein ACI8WM_001507 [Burkholderiaceae bacterium]|jgi:hypothetical protein